MFANRLKSRTLLVQLLLTGACGLPLGAIAGSDLDAGISLYKKGDYRAALSFLQEAVRGADRSNPDAHYMLANTLISCGQTEPALAEYRECYKLAPTGRNAQHCLTALKTYPSAPSSTRPIAGRITNSEYQAHWSVTKLIAKDRTAESDMFFGKHHKCLARVCVLVPALLLTAPIAVSQTPDQSHRTAVRAHLSGSAIKV